ncbi:hypothetical protein MCAG_04287 [Micromonospora sp. ATCC 39149]|nr:hypothetical protein MCAG_04287 [Micromonospora sp. ATCC 39149]
MRWTLVRRGGDRRGALPDGQRERDGTLGGGQRERDGVLARRQRRVGGQSRVGVTRRPACLPLSGEFVRRHPERARVGPAGPRGAVTVRVGGGDPVRVQAVPPGVAVPADGRVGQLVVTPLAGVLVLVRGAELVRSIAVVARRPPVRLAVPALAGVPTRLLIFGKAPSCVHDGHRM